jgi:hypothetical protein
MLVGGQACLCAADVHSRHAAEAFELLGGVQVFSVHVFAARQAGDSRREWRCHRAWHPQLASGCDDGREVACEAERRGDHVADRGVGVEVRADVDVRIALAHLYPRLRRCLGRPVALGGLPASPARRHVAGAAHHRHDTDTSSRTSA